MSFIKRIGGVRYYTIIQIEPNVLTFGSIAFCGYLPADLALVCKGERIRSKNKYPVACDYTNIYAEITAVTPVRTCTLCFIGRVCTTSEACVVKFWIMNFDAILTSSPASEYYIHRFENLHYQGALQTGELSY